MTFDRASFGDYEDFQTQKDGSIVYNGKEVALFYLRAGYDPSCYVNDSAWKSRLEIEKSRAVKTPSIGYHLLTNKVFQAKFADKKILTKFINLADAVRISETFCETFELTNWTDPRIKKVGWEMITTGRSANILVLFRVVV